MAMKSRSVLSTSKSTARKFGMALGICTGILGFPRPVPATGTVRGESPFLPLRCFLVGVDLVLLAFIVAAVAALHAAYAKVVADLHIGGFAAGAEAHWRPQAIGNPGVHIPFGASEYIEISLWGCYGGYFPISIIFCTALSALPAIGSGTVMFSVFVSSARFTEASMVIFMNGQAQDSSQLLWR